MSKFESIPISTPTVGLSSIAEGVGATVGMAIAGAAIAVGGICLAIGKEAISVFRDVYRRCKEGGYPVENLQISYTPLGNFDGLAHLLEDNGFKLNSFGHPDISFAINPLTSESLFIVNSPDGIGVISNSSELIQSTMQSFVTHELAFALEELGFNVKVEEKGGDKIITATDTQRNYVDIKIEKDALKVQIDTRKSRRPKCDIIHQLVSQKLREPNKKSSSKVQLKKRQENIHIRIRQR